MSEEESLDPQNWEELRSLGHRMLDDMLDYLSTVREKPAWQALPDDVKTRFTTPLPTEPQDAAAV
ncbi:MAG TPA: cytochrome D ubiquinol oxidase subunit I, partial [Blastocatellia bacterium]|nr:cytochrome D ubiquinol oxidase subunit I [Blastocatellia bacterium]